jgi:acetoin utilization deacetylase AcuC-like enzyme
MSLVIVHSERFAEHQTPPGHPERPERAEVMDVVASRWRERDTEVVAPPEATRDQLARVHDDPYLDLIEKTAGRAVKLDPDTYTSPESYEIALLAAGAAVDAVDRVMKGPHRAAMALVRPPGHHAERDRAMGFCLYNNVAVAAAYARGKGAARVAIVDYDVHHGNGTQETFWEDDTVLFVSLHQWPFYPGTGGPTEQRKTTVNVPLNAGSGDEEYFRAFDDVVLPAVERFEPELLLVSAGFDAHDEDPLAQMRVTANGFRELSRRCAALGQRVAAVLEGGYNTGTLPHLVAAALEGFSSEKETAG